MDGGNANSSTVENIQQVLRGIRNDVKRQYDTSVVQDLSRQQWQGLFKRNVLSVLDRSYQKAIEGMRGSEGIDAEQTLMAELDGIVVELIEYALEKHHSSCALSNFPEEHSPGREYILETVREASKQWMNFKMQMGVPPEVENQV